MSGTVKQFLTGEVQRLCYMVGFTTWMAKRTTGQARVLMFHGIGDGLHSAELLEAKILYLKKHFQIVSLEEMLAIKASGQPFKNEVVLSFDDGLKNNAEHAYPVLIKHNTPAIFYVCPELIDSGNWLWNHEARERLRTLSCSDIKVIAQDWSGDSELKNWECDTGLEQIVTFMKELSIEERDKAIAYIREQTPDFTPTAAQNNALDIMDWTDLRKLTNDLITIGSHTSSHVIAQNLPESVLKLELVDSKHRLEEQLGRPVDHFCYPNGMFDQNAVSEVRRTYKSAVTTSEGFVEENDDLHLLNRIPSESLLPYFAWQLYRPTIGHKVEFERRNYKTRPVTR